MRHRLLVPAIGIALWVGGGLGALHAQYDDPPIGGDPDTPPGCAGVQAKVTLEAGTLVFNPAHLVVAPGTPVCWTWTGMSHNVRADDASFGSGPPTPNGTFQKTFNTPGTYGYHCQVHGSPQAGMRGEVVVQGADEPPPAGPGTVQVAATTFSAVENAGNAQVVVERVGGSDGKATVLYSTTAGSAKAADFKSVKNKLLTWNAGELGPKTVLVGLKNDKAKESTETFSLKLSKATGATLGASTATVSIADDDSPTCPAASLATPDGFRASGESLDSIRLAWATAGLSEGLVRIERRVADGGFEEITALPAGVGGFTDFGLAPGTTYLYRLRADGGDGEPAATSDIVAASTDGSLAPCTSASGRLCLRDGRFEASVEWHRGDGQPRRLGRQRPLADSDAAGAFSLAGDEPALLVGVVDGCSLNDHFGVTLAVFAEESVTVRVRDTATGRTWTRFVPANGPSALRDADAFATCP